MTDYDRLLDLISKLRAAKIHFTITSVRNDAIILYVAVPGERWEIELMQSGAMEIEKFKSDGTIQNESALTDLFERFKD
jgi:hypothetical protein